MTDTSENIKYRIFNMQTQRNKHSFEQRIKFIANSRKKQSQKFDSDTLN